MRLMCVVVLLLLLPGVASAGFINDTIHGLSPVDAAAASIADGIDLAMIRTADTLMGFAAGNETEAVGGLTGQIIKYASWTINPFEYVSVQKMMGVTLCIALGILMIYVFLGAAYCNLSRFSSMNNTFFHIMDGGSTSNGLQNYSQNVVVGCIATSMMPCAVYVVLMLSHALKETAMLSIVEMIAPGKSIPLLYLAMAVMWMILSVFFGIANVVIIMTGAGSFLIGALYASERTRHISTGWFDYFVSVAFMQVIVVGGVVVVVATMTEIAKADPALWAVLPIDITMYLGTIIAATYIAYRLTIGKTRILRTASNLIAKVA